jgi:nanoRNase/pAp phosphatase (c-di-AMP/oligoRNAs hydrolase)
MQISDSTQQLRETLKQAKKIIIITPENSSVDAIYSMLAWRNELKRRDKEIRLIKPNLDKDQNRFIPYINEFETDLPVQRTTVKVEVGENGIKKMSYEMKEQTLHIYLTPKTGVIRGDQVAVEVEQFDTDAVLTIGLSNPAELKDWPNQWPEEIKQNQVLINLDTHIENSMYGTLNLIDSSKSALSQLSSITFQQFGWEIDPETATFLANGIASATNHFTHNITAEVFEIVSQLMKAGGKLSEKGIIGS